MPQAMKIPEAKGSSGERMGKNGKILAWQLTKVWNKNDVIAEARNEGHTVYFASLMDLCHSQEFGVGTTISKNTTKVQSYSELDIVKDDSGSYAVFTEHGSSASQMTAAKVMDVISRLPGCAGQAADAVSAYTQVKMEDASIFIEDPNVRSAQIFGYVYRRHEWLKSWSSMEDPVVLLERTFFRSPSGRTTNGKGNFEKSSFGNTDGKKFQIGNAYSLTEKKEYFCL